MIRCFPSLKHLQHTCSRSNRLCISIRNRRMTTNCMRYIPPCMFLLVGVARTWNTINVVRACHPNYQYSFTLVWDSIFSSWFLNQILIITMKSERVTLIIPNDSSYSLFFEVCSASCVILLCAHMQSKLHGTIVRFVNIRGYYCIKFSCRFSFIFLVIVVLSHCIICITLYLQQIECASKICHKQTISTKGSDLVA